MADQATTLENFNVNILDWNNEEVEVPIFSLLQWKYALRLECRGMRLSGRTSVYSMLRKKLKAPKSFTKHDMLRHIEGSLKSINEQLGLTDG